MANVATSGSAISVNSRLSWLRASPDQDRRFIIQGESARIIATVSKGSLELNCGYHVDDSHIGGFFFGGRDRFEFRNDGSISARVITDGFRPAHIEFNTSAGMAQAISTFRTAPGKDVIGLILGVAENALKAKISAEKLAVESGEQFFLETLIGLRHAIQQCKFRPERWYDRLLRSLDN